MKPLESMKKFACIAAFALAIISGSSYAQPLKFLGLELGVDRPGFPMCSTADSDARPRKRLCWISKPFVAKNGDKLGSAYIPNEAVPAWATYALYNLHVNRKNAIRGIEADLATACDGRALGEVVDSISARFGRSTDSRTPEPLLMRWESSDGYVQLFANQSRCKITYRSPELQAEVKRQIAEREKDKTSRPTAP